MNRLVPFSVVTRSMHRLGRQAVREHRRRIFARMAIRIAAWHLQQERERALRAAQIAWFYSRIEPGGA